MLDIKFIRDQPETVRQAIRAKQLHDAESKLNQLLLVDEEHRLLRQDLEEKQALRNASSKRIGELKRRGESAEALMREMGQVSEEVKRLEDKSRSLDATLRELLLEMPNPPHESVPYGASEHDNVVLYERGEKPSFDFTPKPHWELATEKGWIDFEAGTKIVGAGFPVFKGDGARLVRALRNYFLDTSSIRVIPNSSRPCWSTPSRRPAPGNCPTKKARCTKSPTAFTSSPLPKCR